MGQFLSRSDGPSALEVGLVVWSSEKHPFCVSEKRIALKPLSHESFRICDDNEMGIVEKKMRRD